MPVLLTHHLVAMKSEVLTTSEMQTCTQPATKLTHFPYFQQILYASLLCRCKYLIAKGLLIQWLHWSSSVARTRVVSFQAHQGMVPRKPTILMNGCVLFVSTPQIGMILFWLCCHGDKCSAGITQHSYCHFVLNIQARL